MQNNIPLDLTHVNICLLWHQVVYIHGLLCHRLIMLTDVIYMTTFGFKQDNKLT